jgi:hypothetical protein
MPVRIILIGAVVFLAAWFTVLRPKPATIELPPVSTAKPHTALGKAVAKAKAVAEATSTATPAAGTSTTTKKTPAPATTQAVPAIPAAALAKLPKDVAHALRARKVLVLAVLSDEASSVRHLADDDRYVRNALAKVNHYHRGVFVKQVGINSLSTYGALVNDLGVSQSPSVVVIDRNLKGRVLTGYTDRVAINQAIADARRDSITPNISDTYLRKANKICGHYETRATRWSMPTVPGKKAEIASLEREVGIFKTYRNLIARTAAPAKWRTLKRQWVAVMADHLTSARAGVKAAKAGKDADATYWAAFDSDAAVKLDHRFDAVGLTDCVFDRRS